MVETIVPEVGGWIQLQSRQYPTKSDQQLATTETVHRSVVPRAHWGVDRNRKLIPCFGVENENNYRFGLRVLTAFIKIKQ